MRNIWLQLHTTWRGSGNDELTFLMKTGLTQPRVITFFFFLNKHHFCAKSLQASINQNSEPCWQMAFILTGRVYYAQSLTKLVAHGNSRKQKSTF